MASLDIEPIMDAELIIFFGLSISIVRSGREYLEFVRNKVETEHEDSIIIYKNTYTLTARDLGSLKRNKWLTSGVLDMLLKEVTLRVSPTPVCLTTFDSWSIDKGNKLQRSTINKIMNSAPERLIVLPVHKGGHFTLFIINRLTRTVTHYDSAHSFTPNYFPETFYEKLCDAFLDARIDVNYVDGYARREDQDVWHFHKADTRQQGNRHDCGIHCLVHAMYADLGADRYYAPYFYPGPINRMRNSLLEIILEPSLHADQEENSLRILNPNVNQREEDDDEIVILEPADNDPVTVEAVDVVTGQEQIPPADDDPATVEAVDVDNDDDDDAGNSVSVDEAGVLKEPGPIWKNVRSIQQLTRFGTIYDLQTEMKKYPDILRGWINEHFSEPTIGKRKFNFCGSINLCRIQKILQTVNENKWTNLKMKLKKKKGKKNKKNRKNKKNKQNRIN